MYVFHAVDIQNYIYYQQIVLVQLVGIKYNVVFHILCHNAFCLQKFVHHLNSSLHHRFGAMIVVSSMDNSCVSLVGQMVEDRVFRVPVSSKLSQK